MATPKKEPAPSTSNKFSFSKDPNLEEIRQLHARFSDERDWDQFHTPRNLLLAMVGEVGEVAELFQWRGEVADGLPDWSDTDRTALEEELSDVLIYLVRLSEKCKIDLPAAVLRKIEINRRKYPAEKFMGSSKKYTEYQQESPKVNGSFTASYSPLESMQKQIDGLNITSKLNEESSSDESNTEACNIVRMAKKLEAVQFVPDSHQIQDSYTSSTPDSD